MQASFEIREGCKVSCSKIIVWSIVAEEGVLIQYYFIFEYGTEYGAECSAKSSSKYYFKR